jgi:hypothetical protein
MFGRVIFPPFMCQNQPAQQATLDRHRHPQPTMHAFQQYVCLPLQQVSEKLPGRLVAAYIRNADGPVTVYQGSHGPGV